MTSLPFGKSAALKQIGQQSPQYATVQLLAQQVAYLLSDKIFTYSPETFDLDVAVKQWTQDQERNAFGFVPGIEAMQTRIGAGSIALGYVFSPDFDMAKRHIPQSIIASSGSLLPLRETLAQLSLLHALANPFVAHVSSADYSADSGLVSDHVSAFEIADDLAFALVASSSATEAQHMALFSTVLASVLPTIHSFDGITGQDTVSVENLLSQATLKTTYDRIVKQLSSTESKHSDNDGKALRALSALNGAVGTKYQPFEYHGHNQATHILVVFGSVEASLAVELAKKLSKSRVKVGVVNVRLYRPFIEEEFLRVLPKTIRKISILGQVDDETLVDDVGVYSRLYQDVFAALTFSTLAGNRVTVEDVKYAKHQSWTHASMLSVLQRLTGANIHEDKYLTPDSQIEQISFWTLDESPVTKALSAFGSVYSQLSKSKLHIRRAHDNLVQGGVSRYDITSSPHVSNISGLVQLSAASLAFVGSEKILKEFDVVANIRPGGTLVLAIPGFKDEDLTKKVSDSFLNQIVSRKISMLILDSAASATVLGNAENESALVLQAIAKLLEKQQIISGGVQPIERQFGEGVTKSIAEELPSALRTIEIPEVTVSEDEQKLQLASDLCRSSFAPFDQAEDETGSRLDDWIIAAKGAVFKEVYGTQTSLRPDTGVKTAIVHVKEHRRLTPKSYERNVFHIEFDLGDSGLTYAIGEALGIHAENDTSEVNEFIKWYGLNPAEIVQVPSREDASILENRTVYQALIQNVDIFGKPPKRFYEQLAEFATEEKDKKNLLTLSLPEGATEFKRRAEVDFITFADILGEFPSAHPSFQDLIRIVSPLKRREYSIASSQHVTPTSVALLIVTVDWEDSRSRKRFGLATRYLNSLSVGSPVTVSVKPSVMKLPPKTTAPIIMAGLGTGLAPFRAFVQERAYQKQVLGQEIGSVLLYLGSRHQREEYLYGEEWEAYQAAGIITLIGAAFSRDQPQKIYIQDRMRQTMDDIRQAYIREEGGFYLCGPTWPVPDVTEVLQEAVELEMKSNGVKKVDGRREIETLKDGGRFVLEVY